MKPGLFAAHPAHADPALDALVALLHALKAEGYGFVTPTPATHRRVLRRPDRGRARTLRDIFGWSLPFAAAAAPPAILGLLRDAGALAQDEGGLRSAVRVSSLGDDLFLHSAFPPSAADAVFFGPDTYRFASFLEQRLQGGPPPGFAVDVGAGSGAGGAVVARVARPGRLILTDINPNALRLAKANLAAADIPAELRLAEGIAIDEPADLIVANPPFIADTQGRTYRDGGDMHGARLSLDWCLQAAGKLASGGRLLMYTGVAIVEGRDPLAEALTARLPEDCTLTYRELDPDIFGEQLNAQAYADVDRIAAVGIEILRS